MHKSDTELNSLTQNLKKNSILDFLPGYLYIYTNFILLLAEYCDIRCIELEPENVTIMIHLFKTGEAGIFRNQEIHLSICCASERVDRHIS